VTGAVRGVARRIRHHARCGWLVVRCDPRAFYTVLADDRIRALARERRAPPAPMWLNLGYWKSATTLPEACAALARLLGERAHLTRGDRVLEVGCGFAQAAVYWAETVPIRHLVGLNITPLQMIIGRALVRARMLESRVALALGSATDLPFGDGAFDKLIALESAFHFNTRERFFAEARRVLRPDGRLVLADMLPLPGARSDRPVQRLRRRIIAVPPGNMYDRDAYATKLGSCGFSEVVVESIREDVYAPFARCLTLALKRRADVIDVVVPLDDAERHNEQGALIWERHGLGDYVVAAATR
jgi:microcystin synthetase protein McyJ